MVTKVINTPSLLQSQYGGGTNESTNESTQNVKHPSATSEGMKQQQMNRDSVKEVDTSSLTFSQDVGAESYGGDYTYETRPNKYKFGDVNYNSSSRRGPTPSGKKRSLSSVQAIVLHHTAGPSYKDRGKQCVEVSFKDNYKSSHAIMDGDGHIEYMIPVEYVANTQGIIYTDKVPAANKKSISIEIQNVGYVKKQDKINGIQYYGRGTGTYHNFLPEDQVSQVYDYDLQVIKGKKYKGQKFFEEYSLAQTEALAKWIKEMLKITGINWKFTKETYKQMFPNKSKSKLPLKHEIEKNVLFVAFKKSSKGDTLGRGKYGGWGISEDFYKGVKGVYTHCSITQDKTDIGPTYNIIKMLKTHFS